MFNFSNDIGLAVFRKIGDLWQGAKADSLIDYTQTARVEPYCMIDADCVFHEAIGDIQQSLLSIFAGYYLQAVAISTTVGKVEVMRELDKLNPNRNALNSAANSAGWLLAEESYKYRLPTPTQGVALERNSEDDRGRSEVGLGKFDNTAILKEVTNLSVGKLLNVEITDGLHKATITIAVRIMASTIPTQNLANILAMGSEDTSTKERYHAWRSGRIDFIKDLVLCQDLIDAHKKNLMADKEGIYAAMLKRQRSNQLSTIVSANPSVATASNLVVISSETASQLEVKINGRLSDFKTREKLFKKTYVMIMVVLDKQFDMVTFYHRGISHATEVPVRSLKSANKGGGPDISDILKAYQLGNSPSL